MNDTLSTCMQKLVECQQRGKVDITIVSHLRHIFNFPVQPKPTKKLPTRLSDLCVFFPNLPRYSASLGNSGGSLIVGNLEWTSSCNWYESHCATNTYTGAVRCLKTKRKQNEDLSSQWVEPVSTDTYFKSGYIHLHTTPSEPLPPAVCVSRQPSLYSKGSLLEEAR